MAPYTYSYALLVIIAIGAILHIVNITRYKKTGYSFSGKVEKGTPAFRTMESVSSAKGYIVASSLLTLSLGSILFEIRSILGLSSRSRIGILIGVPVFCIGIAVVTFFRVKNKLNLK